MKCRYCNREPKDIHYYQCFAKGFNLTPEEAVESIESSYEPDTDKFTWMLPNGRKTFRGLVGKTTKQQPEWKINIK